MARLARHQSAVYITLLSILLSGLLAPAVATAQLATPEIPVPTVETVAPVTPTAVPVTPEPEAPAETPVPANEDTFLLASPTGYSPVTLNGDGTIALAYDYTVTTGRAATEITADIVSLDNSPSSGWSATFSATGENVLVDGDHVTAGETISVSLVIHGPVGETASRAQLTLRSTVIEPDGVSPQAGTSTTLTLQSAMTPPTANSGTSDETGTPVASSVATPGAATPAPDVMAPMSVTPRDGSLSCANANTGYGVADALAPGEIIAFECRYSFNNLGLLPSFRATMTLSSPAVDDGWRIAVSSPSLTVLNLEVLGGVTEFGSSQEVSTTGLASIGNVVDFTVYLKAPLAAPVSGADHATVEVETSCDQTLGFGNNACGGTLTPAVMRTAELTGVLYLTNANSGGGALLNGTLLPGIPLGTVLFGLSCEDINADRMILQGATTVARCTLRSTAGLNLLGLVSLGGTISLSSSPGPYTYAFQSPYTCPGDLLSICLGSIVDLGVLETGIPIDILITPQCNVDTTNSLYSIRLDADFGLSLLGSAVAVPLTDGWATVPFQITEGGPVLPAISLGAPAVDFGTSRWTGSGYPTRTGTLPLTISQPDSGCRLMVSSISISMTGPMANQTAESTISQDNILLDSVTQDQSIPWGYADPDAVGPLNQTYTVFVTTSSDTSATPTAEVDLGLIVDPPPEALPGNYQGTVTITVTEGDQP